MLTRRTISKKDHQTLRNIKKWNKHAGTHFACRKPSKNGSSAMPHPRKSGTLPKKVNPLQSCNIKAQNHKFQMKQEERPKSSKNSVVEQNSEDSDTDSDTDSTDSSTSSESDVEVNSSPKCTNTCLDNTESDGESDSSSTDCSSSSSNSSHSKTIPQPPPPSSMCAMCGQGPFRCMKLHLLHCKGIGEICRCFLCKKVFLTIESLKEHHMLLFSCDVCGQVFSREALFIHHPCPKGSVSPLVLFCSEAMPKVCNICKSFFSSERMLFAHITRAHASVVKTKVCMISKPPLLSDRNGLTGVSRTNVQSATSISHTATQTINGRLNVHHASMYPMGKSSLSPSCSDTLPVTVIKTEAEPVRIDDRDVPFPPIGKSSKSIPPPLFKHHTDTLASAVPEPESTSPPSVPPLLENDRHNKDSIERLNTNWRSKATYPCRQCGAIFRQPSLVISHRYLHRGRRTYQCHCGRAFKHQLHLLRHCVQHAEAVDYICVGCGDTFTGAKLLAEHLRGKSAEKCNSGRIPGRKVMKKCRMPFTCDCGQLFFRPSAFIWHQLRNRTKSRRSKNNPFSSGF